MPLDPPTALIGFGQIQVGQVFETAETFGAAEMDHFAELSGDYSGVHTDSEFAKHFAFPDRIQYGFLLASLLSRIVGANFDHAVCASVSLDFMKPVIAGEPVEVRAEVTHVQEAIRSVVMKITMHRGQDLVIRGKLTTVFLQEAGSQITTYSENPCN